MRQLLAPITPVAPGAVIAASDVERSNLLQVHSDALDLKLAYRLKEICQQGWASDPARTLAAATTLDALISYLPQREVRSLADWSAGIAALTMGQMETALARLDEAHAGFEALGHRHTAASTQVSKVIALAMTGSYDLPLYTSGDAYQLCLLDLGLVGFFITLT